MKHVHLHPFVWGSALTPLLFSSCTHKTLQNEQPNIILIMADDMGYSDIGCFGSEIQTPHLDRLASEGMIMTQFYNASRCCPTRASLLTGLYQHQAGVGAMVDDLGFPPYQGYLNDQCVTMAEVLKEAGYQTLMSGKWHVGETPEYWPLQRGFDRYFGLINGASSYFDLKGYRYNQPDRTMALDNEKWFPPDSGFYMTDAFTSHAIRFIEEASEKKAPFFLYLAYTAPHWPLHALPGDIDKYLGKYMTGWDSLRLQRLEKMKSLGILPAGVDLSPPDHRVPPWSEVPEEEKEMWDRRMAVYSAMIDRMDQGIGKILETLEKQGREKNTFIVFLADNGGCHEPIKNRGAYLPTDGITGFPGSFDSYEYPWANASNTPFRLFKHWVHEGGIASPFIAWYPGFIPAGSISHSPAHIIDLMPTFVELSGAAYPESFSGKSILPMEGESLVHALKGQRWTRTSTLFWEHMGNRAVREGDWKLVSEYDNSMKKFRPWELYDIAENRTETNDLSDKHPEIVSAMIRSYDTWAGRAGVIPKNELDSIRAARR